MKQLKFHPAPAAPISVTQLNRMVSAALAANLPGTLLVAGEISDLARPASGHLYFTLKDADSAVRCVMWRSAAAAMRFKPADGMAVIATGSVEVYEPRGQYQLVVRRLEPQGIGALELAFRQLKEKLAKEGLFDPARKRPLPVLPRCIAVVTSLVGAAVRDILQTIRRRFPAVRVLIYPVRVQGEGSAQEQHERLGGIDVMIVGRGGGSLEDLWAFNEEIVARAIHACRIPVVSAVGHEIDFTIADFVADARAATPTAAAELVVPVLSDLLDDLIARQSHLVRDARRRIDLARAKLDGVARSEWFRDPLGRVRQRQQRVDEASGRLNLALTRRLKRGRELLHRCELAVGRARPEAVLAQRREAVIRCEHRLRWSLRQAGAQSERRLSAALARVMQSSPIRLIERNGLLLRQVGEQMARSTTTRLATQSQRLAGLAARLEASSHEQVLRRGFTITRMAKSRRIVRAAREVRPDDRIVTQTADGEFGSRVTDARQGELFS
jgi:exodeoxyribonuclease VII large subunit